MHNITKYTGYAILAVVAFIMVHLMFSWFASIDDKQLEAIDEMIALCDRPDIECFHERTDGDTSRPYVREITQ